MTRSLKVALLSATHLTAFANSNAGSKFYICSTPQTPPVAQVALAALTWIEVGGFGSHGQGGTQTNILTYDTWNTDVIQKAKGMSDAGSPEIEVARSATDAGQVALRAAALTNLNYATKMERNDKPSGVGATPTIIYNVGIVTGPTRPFGRNEDFDLEVFTFGYNQREIVVAPTPGT